MSLNSDADLKKAIAWAKQQDRDVIDWDKFGNRFPELDVDKMKGFVEKRPRFPRLAPMIAEKLVPEPVPYGAPAGEQARGIGLNILKDIGAFSTWPIGALETLLHPGAQPIPEEVPAPLRGTPLERPGAVAKGLFWEFPKAVGRSYLDITTGIALAPQAQLPGLFGRLKPAEQKRYQASLERLAEHPLIPIAGALGMKGLAAAGKKFVEPTARYKAAVKVAERPEMADIETYYKSIMVPQLPRTGWPRLGKASGGETPQMPYDVAIAAMEAARGRVTIPEDFATYPNFKDARPGMGGGTKDPIRFIQEIDGALSVQQKAKLPGQAGPTEKYVLRRTEDMVRLKVEWSGEQMIRGKKVVEGLSRKQEELVTRVLEETSRPGAYVETGDFATNLRIRKITTDTKVVKAAQESRKLLEHWFKEQNKMRVLRNQPEIPYRQYYAPHKLKEATLWSRVLGLREKDPMGIIERPQLPDYIKPDKPFNPRELAREAEMPEYLREMRISRLLEDYANTAARDIFHTCIIQNAKAFVQGLEARGLRHAAEGVGSWAAEGFGGIKGAFDRSLNAPHWFRKGMRIWRTGLIRSVFPLNWMWNSIVQTSSSILTVAKGGAANAVRGAVDWFGNERLRTQIVDNAYSAMIKAQKAGRITEQDINIGMTKAVKLRKTKFETGVDAANYLTEFIERHLTGWSIASGLRQGVEQGLRGRALWDYASDMGAKTQSMYNLENLPGMLRSEVVKTAAPFQTFSFELFNTMREFLGKTGTPPGTASQRIGWALRFIGGVIAVQQIGGATTGRKPYDVYSFFPFADTWLKPIVNALRGKVYETARGRGLPSPVASLVELFGGGLRTFLKTGDTRRLRNWAIKYVPGLAGIPGGTQVSRMVDGIIAVADGGLEDSSDRMLFPITETKEQIRAITMGPWRTEAGKEYWEKREVPFTEMFKRKEKKLPFTPLRAVP